MKNKINKKIYISLSLFISFSLLIFGCDGSSIVKKEKLGDGNIITKIINISNIESVDISGNFKVEINKRKTPHLEIKIDDNLLKYIRFDQNKSILSIELEKYISLKPSEPIAITLGLKSLNNITATGNIHLVSTNLNATTTKLNFSGSIDAALKNVTSKQIFLNTSGMSSIKISGRAERAEYNLSGNTNLEADSFKIKNLALESSGSLDAKVYASEKLKLNTFGRSSIEYHGSPKQIINNHSGFFSLVSANK